MAKANTMNLPVIATGSTPTAPVKSVRTRAREDGVDLAKLLTILSLQRPSKSKADQEFCDTYLLPIEGMQEDSYGNMYLTIGENPTTMWSCHTDTVSNKSGHQNIEWKGDVLALHKGKPGQCLGADDGAGIWLMLEMIKAKKPGLYIFHRDEEVGGLGSDHIVKQNPDLVEGIERAIAFDRKGTDSVITHQRGARCCSATFAKALAVELNKTEGFNYKEDPTGSFTDTANYDGIIPECTNLSVGYYNQHGPRETLDVAHLYDLRDALLAIDFEALPTERDPKVTEYDDWEGGGWGGYGGGYNSYYSGRTYAWNKPVKPKTELEKMEETIRGRAYTLARYFQQENINLDDINAWCEEYWASQPSLSFPGGQADEDDGDDLTYEDEDDFGLYCYDCSSTIVSSDTVYGQAREGDPCSECGSLRTEVVELNPVTDPDEGKMIG